MKEGLKEMTAFLAMTLIALLAVPMAVCQALIQIIWSGAGWIVKKLDKIG